MLQQLEHETSNIENILWVWLRVALSMQEHDTTTCYMCYTCAIHVLYMYYTCTIHEYSYESYYVAFLC